MKNNNISAIIINVQRFSIHDGPGIRTTVFFKGCNLRCLWCHNPESQSARPERMFYKHKCVGCGACRAVCDVAFGSGCDACGTCTSVCLYGAREISGRTVSVDELLSEIKKDKDFYEVSNGGVTFSGGEPLLQFDFLFEILRQCKESGIRTAIETAGNVPWERIEALIPYLDDILFDIKAIDESKHVALTGVTNRVILKNAEKLRNTVPEKVLFRMPVVPGYNDSEIDEVVKFVNGHRLELMPYHTIGVGKYEALGVEYALRDVKPPESSLIKSVTERYENVFSEA